MIIYRVPPYPLSIAVPVNNGEYDWVINDENQYPVATGSADVTTGTLTVAVPTARYDAEYILEAYDNQGNQVIDEPVFVVRPYLDMNVLTGTPAQKQKQEVVARGIIDSITGGFYYTKQSYETEGTGSDYLPIPIRINKLLKVYEAGVLVYDALSNTNIRNLAVSQDRSSIIEVNDEERNPNGPIRLPPAMSDYIGGWSGRSGSFPNGLDYIVEFESGFSSVPLQVRQAAQILANDVACGSDYLSHYVLEYSTDQYKIRFSARALAGTGNKTVDQLLSGLTEYNVRAGLI